MVSDHPFIDETSEHRQFAPEHGVKNKSRAERGDVLGCDIARDGTERTKQVAKLLRRYTGEPDAAKLEKHMKSIRNLSSLLGLDCSVTDRAWALYKEAVEADKTKRRKELAIDAACLFHACNEKGLAKTWTAFEQYIRDKVSKKEFNSACDALKELPSIQNLEQHWETLVKEYMGPLKLPRWIEDAAIDMAKGVREAGLCEGKTRQGVIGAVIWLATDACPAPSVKRSLEEVSKKVGLKEETVSARVQEIRILMSSFRQLKTFSDMMQHKA